MIAACEMSTYLFSSLTNVVVVPLESIHQPTFSLAYILYAVFSASDAVDNITAFASDIGHSCVHCTSNVAGYLANEIEFGAVSS